MLCVPGCFQRGPGKGLGGAPGVTQPCACSRLSEGDVEAILSVVVTEELLTTGFEPAERSGIDQSA